MAVPTLSTITPASGYACGRTLVEIAGTNFRTRTVAYEIPQATQGPTVQVLFGSSEAEAWAQSETLILALVPQYLGSAELDAFPPVGVTVKNLDDDGDPIAGETATLTAAYTYQRFGLALPAVDPPLLQVLYALIHSLKRNICRNVVVQTHPDYADAGATYTVLQQLPALAFDKIYLSKDQEWNQWDNVREIKNGKLWRAPETHMLIADFLLADEHEGVAHRMADGLLELLRVQPYLYVPGDARWSSDANEYPLEMSEPLEQASTPGRSGVYSFSGQLRVRGIPLIPEQPVTDIYQIVTLVCALSTMSAPSFQTHTWP